MTQCSLCGQGLALLWVVDVAAAKCGPTGALQCGSVRGQHTEADVVAEPSPDFPTLWLNGLDEGEGVQPG
jgi:hypothetical protein